jgi:6-phosphogluconolactonase/glucosamine-6-phosphate isomerase/deaminase
MPWGAVHAWWGDERCLPQSDPASNAGRARAGLLDRVPIPPGQVPAIDGTLPPAEAAQIYDDEVRRAFGDGPTFDVALLVLAADGHCASLFPGDAALEERSRLAVAVRWVTELTRSADPDRNSFASPWSPRHRVCLHCARIASFAKARHAQRCMAPDAKTTAVSRQLRHAPNR